MNNNTKGRFKQLTYKERSESAKQGYKRKSIYPKVARNKAHKGLVSV